MASMTFHGIQNHYLKGVHLEIQDGEFFILMGHSGAGKTTLLQAAAGLIPYGGQILLNQQPVDSKPSHLRGMGYVFQDLLLFPHMSVEENIGIGLSRLGWKRIERRKKIHDVMALFQIDHLAKRYPRTLSGGEKQRVALARAVGSDPDILLLDEPFGSLDYRTARYLRLEIKRLQRYLNLTVLFVTHSLDEARELGDRIGIMKKGRLDRIVSPKDMWTHRQKKGEELLESAYGRMNLLIFTNRKELGNGLVEVAWAGLKILVPDDGEPFDRVAIHPAHVYISRLQPPGPHINRFQASVMAVENREGDVRVLLDVNGSSLHAEISNELLETLRLSPGDLVHGILKLRALRGV